MQLAVRLRRSAPIWAHSLIGKTAVSKTVVTGSKPVAPAISLKGRDSVFAVKSDYCIQPARDITIPFYVAEGNIFFKRTDIADTIYGSLFGVLVFSCFENYDGDFVNFIECRNFFLEQPQRFMNRDFWRDIFNQDYSKVIAEVRDAQHFVKEYFRLDLPEEWHRLKVDAVIANLPVKATEWIEKCHNSLRILATNDEQRKDACRVYDKAWEILKAREKDATADKRPTVHETLAKFGLTDDDLIQAVLDVHETKFAKQQARRKTQFEHEHNVLSIELRQLLE